jgi:hypothetical protein
MSDRENSAPMVGRAVLGRANARRRTVYIEEWGGNVQIRQMSAAQVSSIQAVAQSAVDTSTAQIKNRAQLSRFNFLMIRDSWIDDEGAYVITDDDFETMQNQPHTVISALVTAINEFNGMDGAAPKEAKKNSPATQNGVSGIN